MTFDPVKLPPQNSRLDAAERINHAMARFPLVLRVLGELAESGMPLPGDDDIRHGCERALTRILADLSRITPATTGKPSPAEDAATSWLDDPAARRLIDADRLERIQQLIDAALVRSGSFR